jgi:A118 family predicted phage portal protein
VPLPQAGADWPPKELRSVYTRLSAWSAWYSGDPDELQYVYGRGGVNPYDTTDRDRPTNHPAQYRGGVVGWLARWFWGEPVGVGQRRTKLHMPAAGDIATTSADLLFSEPPTITVEHPQTQARLEELVDCGVHAKLIEAAEMAAALGGVYLRVCWDTEAASRPWLAPVHADAALPEWSWDRLAAVTFWQVIEATDNKVVRHLERHEPGVILHGVYEGTPDKLGKAVALGGFAATKGLQPVIETGVPKLTAVYIANMRPNKLWRRSTAAAHWGRSDYAGVEPLMDALDECWSSWMRDVRLGKARIIVPDVYLQSLGTGKGARWDNEREIYEQLNMLPQPGGPPQISAQQFAIRVTEHQQTSHELLTRIVGTAGYAAQTFGLVGEVAVTATEVAARERKSMITRDKKLNYVKPELADILETLLAIDAAVFGTPVEPQLPDLEFAAVVSEDPQSLAQTAQLLRAAEAASTRTLVELVNPDWDDTAIDEEVGRIQAETGTGAAASPIDLGGPPAYDPSGFQADPGTVTGGDLTIGSLATASAQPLPGA